MELTSTERIIAKEVSLGYSEKQIADRLCVSPKTVGNHKYNILRKNNLNNTADIVREFILSLDDPRKFFAAMMFLIIQIFCIATSHQQDVRRLPKLSKRVNRSLVLNRNIESC